FEPYIGHARSAAPAAAGAEESRKLENGVFELAEIAVPLSRSTARTEVDASGYSCKGFRLAGIPHSVTTAGLFVKAHLLTYIEAVTGRADVGAVAACETSFVEFVPHLAFKCPFEEFGKMTWGYGNFILKYLPLIFPQVG